MSVPSSPPLTPIQRCRTTECATPPNWFFCFWRKKKKKIWRIYSFYSTLSRSNENGYDDYMCKCTKSLTLQRYIIPKLQKILKHAFNCLKGCWMLPLKKVAVLKISNCWWGFLGTFVTSMLLLHLPDNLSRHGGVEIDCVVPQALSCLVTLSAATFEGFAYADLCSVAILGVVLDAVHILRAESKALGARCSDSASPPVRTQHWLNTTSHRGLGTLSRCWARAAH